MANTTAITAEVERAERWRREREIDEVAISLGLAHSTPQHGICYWPPSNKESFRKGYEAGMATPRSSLEQLQLVQVRETPELLAAIKEAAKTPGPLLQVQQLHDETTFAPVARYVAYRRCGCYQGFTNVGTPGQNNSASYLIARWIRDGCLVKPLPADAFYVTDPCPVHAKKGG